MFAVIDIETTGLQVGFHEIIQIGVLPLNPRLEPDGRPFYTNIRPEHPHREDHTSTSTHGLNLEELRVQAPAAENVIDYLVEWCDQNGNRRIPLAHNWTFELGFLTHWLGEDTLLSLFDLRARDTMQIAAYLNDRAFLRGEKPMFERVTLTRLCRKLGVKNENPHDALSDCLATAEVYRRLLRMGI